MTCPTVGASPALAKQNTPQDVHKSEWTCVSWFNKISDAVANKTCRFFGRAVAAVVSVVVFIPSLAVDFGYAVKSLYGRKIAKPQTPLQNQMSAVNGQAPTKTSATPVLSDVESLKAQLALKEQSEQVKINQIIDNNADIALLKHKLERQKSQFELIMEQLKEKDRYIQWLDKILVKDHVELEKTKAKCVEHEKNEKALHSLLAKHMKDMACRDIEIQALRRRVGELTDDNQCLMLRNDNGHEALVNQLNTEHEAEDCHLTQALREVRVIDGGKDWWASAYETVEVAFEQLDNTDGGSEII